MVTGLGKGYNRISAKKGPVVAMDWVYRRAVQLQPKFSPPTRASFNLHIERWARKLQDRDPKLLGEYVKINKRFGDGEIWKQYVAGRGLARGYNRIYAKKGPVVAMGWVYRRAVQLRPTFSPAAQAIFDRELEKWARTLQDGNPRLLGPYVKINSLTGLEIWIWTPAATEKEIAGYDWDGHPAKQIHCKGTSTSQNGEFSDLRCEFLKADRWTNFHLHVASDTQFTTSDWRNGRIGSARSVGGCATASGTRFQLDGVSCGMAVNVWFAYMHGNELPGGWTCSYGRCEGTGTDFTGLAATQAFTWHA